MSWESHAYTDTTSFIDPDPIDGHNGVYLGLDGESNTREPSQVSHKPSPETLHRLLDYALSRRMDFSYSYLDQQCQLFETTASSPAPSHGIPTDSIYTSARQSLRSPQRNHPQMLAARAEETVSPSSASCLSMQTWHSRTTLAVGEEVPPDFLAVSKAAPGVGLAQQHAVTCRPMQPETNYLACSCCRPAKHFDDEKSLLRHQKEKPFRCEWQNCSTRTSTKSDLQRHINSIHENKEYWSCRGLRDTDLTEHMAFHVDSNGFHTVDVCGLCNAQFSRPPAAVGEDGKERKTGPNLRDMRRHGCEDHFGRPCQQAEKDFFRGDLFRKHLRKYHHTDEANSPADWEARLLAVCKHSRETPSPSKADGAWNGTG